MALSTRSAGVGRRTHRIDLRELIVHRYADIEALLKKAEQIARTIIPGELRSGETFRTLEAGVYEIVLTRLTPEAGDLRCALIAEKLMREIRRLNPTTIALEKRRKPEASSQRPAKRPPSRRAGPTSTSTATQMPLPGSALPFTPGPLSPAMASAPSFHEAPFRNEPTGAGTQARFQPVWHVQNNVITGYRCILGGLSDDPMADARHDAAVFAHAVAGLRTLLQRGLRALVIAPIHLASVSHPRFAAALQQQDGSLTPEASRLIVFELLDVATEASRYRLRDAAERLRGRCRAVLARTGPELPNLESLKDLNLHAVGLDIGRYLGEEEQLIPVLDQYAAAAQAQGLHSYIHGLRTTSLAVAAIGAGFTYIDGPVVADEVPSPAHVQSFGVQHLYRH